MVEGRLKSSLVIYYLPSSILESSLRLRVSASLRLACSNPKRKNPVTFPPVIATHWSYDQNHLGLHERHGLGGGKPLRQPRCLRADRVALSKPHLLARLQRHGQS